MAEPPPPDTDLAEVLRQADRERWLTTLFAPEAVRGRLVVLYAFDLELSRIPAQVSQPMLGEIRFQWWREALDEAARGQVRRQPLVEALAELHDRGLVDAAAVERMIAARAAALYDAPPVEPAALERLAADTGGALATWAARALGADVPAEVTEAVGTAYALAGLIRRGERLPDRAGIADLVGRGRALLKAARARRRDCPPAALPALLPATLAELHFRRIERAGCDPAGLAPLAPLAPPLRLLRAAVLRRW